MPRFPEAAATPEPEGFSIHNSEPGFYGRRSPVKVPRKADEPSKDIHEPKPVVKLKKFYRKPKKRTL